MSNCKPGDLCQVVRIGCDPCMKHFLGAVVTVRTPMFLADGISWFYAEPPKVCRGCGDVLTSFPDDSLKPIRGIEGDHPGDVKVKKKSTVSVTTHSRTVLLPTKQGDA